MKRTTKEKWKKAGRCSLWLLFALITTFMICCFAFSLRYDRNDVFRYRWDASSDYERAVACLYGDVQIMIVNVPLSICAWYGLIRALCGKPFALPRKKPRRYNPTIVAVILGALTVFLLMMSLRARAEYFAVLKDPDIEGYSGEHGKKWVIWSTAMALSMECTIPFVIAGIRERKRKGLNTPVQKDG